MRTTIDLPDEIVKKAKMKAVENGVSLKSIFISALQKELGSSVATNHSEAPWKKLKGMGSSQSITPDKSGFEDYSGPDWNYVGVVNESGQ